MDSRVDVVLQFIVDAYVAAPDVAGFPVTGSCFRIPQVQFIKVIFETQLPTGIVELFGGCGVRNLPNAEWQHRQQRANHRNQWPPCA